MVDPLKTQILLSVGSISLERLKIWMNPTIASSPDHALSRNASYLDG